jgi:ABC-type multidrug transport system fused ATPase/permease subunit
MAQMERSREERIAEQRQADNDSAYFVQSMNYQQLTRNEKIAEQRQTDNDNERGEEEAIQQANEEAQDEAEEEKRGMADMVLRGLHLRRQKVQEAEGKLVTAVEEKAVLWDYKFAFSAAILKDLLDLAGFSVPVVSFIVTALFSIIIFVALYFAKTNKKLLEMRYFVKKFVVWITGFITEAFLFGANLFPIQTLVVYLIYLIDRSASDEQIEKAVEFLDTIKKARF